MACHESRPLIGWFKKGAWPSMYISLRWGGGGGCHGDMPTKPRAKVRTFDLPLSNVCTEFFMHIVR